MASSTTAASTEPSTRDSNSEVTFDVDDAWDHIGFGRFHVKLVMIAGLFLAADAMEMMLLSFLGPTLRCTWGLSGSEEALLTTVVFAGMMLGTYSWGVAGDRYGRRLTLVVISTATFIFGVASALAVDFAMLLVARTLLGACLGGFGVGFSYVMEMVPQATRGKVGTLIQFWWTIGTVVEAAIAWAALPTGPDGWRWMIGLSAVPLLFLTVFFVTLPPSPRFLLSQGRDIEARQVLMRAAQENGIHSLPEGVLSSGTRHNGSSQTNQFTAKGALVKLFSKPLFRTTVLLWFIWFMVALVYYGIVLLTTSIMLHEGTDTANSTANGTSTTCNLDDPSPFTNADFEAVFVASFSELPGVLLAMLLVDTLGRKHTQAALFLVAGVAIISLCFYARSRAEDTFVLFVARAGIEGAFVTAFVYTPEVYPTSIRTTGFGAANSFGRLGGMLSPFIAQDLFENGFESLSQAILGVAALAGCVASLMLFTETKGQKLAETMEETKEWDDERHRERAGQEEPLVEDANNRREEVEQNVPGGGVEMVQL